jgi:hypothetical protein
MFPHAVNLATTPHLALSSAMRVNGVPVTDACDGEMPSFSTAPGQTNEAAMLVNLLDRDAKEDFGSDCVSRFVSRLLLGHYFGAHSAPGGTWSSALPTAPVPGLGSSQNKFVSRGREHRTNFFRAPPRKQTFGTWEPGPLARLRPV